MNVLAKMICLKNGLELSLRSPTSNDAQLLLDHIRNVFRTSYRNMNQAQHHWDNFPVEKEREILANILQDEGQFMISAFLGERIVGNIACMSAGRGFQEANASVAMGVEAEFHGMGLGTELLNYVFEIAKSLKYHRLQLTVRTFNNAGIALYEKMGFRRVGELEEIAFIEGQYFNEYMYEKIL